MQLCCLSKYLHKTCNSYLFSVQLWCNHPNVLQARSDHLQSQAQAFLQKLKLPLQHKLSLGPLPVSLQFTAAVLGMPADTLTSTLRGGRKLNDRDTPEQNAIHSTLLPRLMNIQQQLNDGASMLEGLQQSGNSDPMLSCVTTYLTSQLHICKHALTVLHLNAMVAVD